MLIHPWATLCYANTSLCENSYSARNKIITQQLKLLLFSSQNLSATTGDAGVAVAIPGSGRSPGEGNANPLQYSCLENSMGRGSWWTVAHGVTKTQLRTKHTHSHHWEYTPFNKCTVHLSLNCTYLLIRDFELPWWFSWYGIHLQYSRHRKWGFDSWVEKIHWRRKCQLTPVFWP